MTTMQVQLFGRLAIQCEGQAVCHLEAGRVQELLVYLLLHRDRPQPREGLADLVCGEGAPAQLRKGLRQALWRLQSILEAANGATRPCWFQADRESVQITSHDELWLDVATFEATFQRTKGIAGADMTAETAEAVSRAVDLHRSDLLVGWYQDWCLLERERLQTMYLILLDKLTAHCESHAMTEAGLDYAARVLQCDRTRERTYRQMMRLLYNAGDRIGALRQYERCVSVLETDLGVEPARRTVALSERIRQDGAEGEPSTLNLPAASSTMAPATSSDELFRSLQSLRTNLIAIQERVAGEIAHIERVSEDIRSLARP